MVTIIAEAGKNYITQEKPQPLEELLSNAKALALEAKQCGATIVKYQTHYNDELSQRHESRHAWIERNVLPLKDFWIPLKEYCDEIEIEFLSTPMSLGAATMIEPLVKRWKIGSGNNIDWPLLDYVCKTDKPVIISTGMSTGQEVTQMVNYVRTRTTNFTIMHCTSEYPLPDHKADLRMIREYEWKYQAEIGCSDHTKSVWVPAIAYALGAKVIEKHFTLNHDDWGPDHKISLLPGEFQQMVNNIKFVESVLGQTVKGVSHKEKELRKIFKPI